VQHGDFSCLCDELEEAIEPPTATPTRPSSETAGQRVRDIRGGVDDSLDSGDRHYAMFRARPRQPTAPRIAKCRIKTRRGPQRGPRMGGWRDGSMLLQVEDAFEAFDPRPQCIVLAAQRLDFIILLRP